MKASGLFPVMRASNWRRQRLLILCYHGVSLDDEHLWKPELYINPPRLRERLELLRGGGYSVLSLEEGVRRLYEGSLPNASVVITFDDGNYDFYLQAFPLLNEYSFPVTVYQTTYYCGRREPIFRLMCSYLLWKRRGSVLDLGNRFGPLKVLDLRTHASRASVEGALAAYAGKEQLSAGQQNDLARELAGVLDIDYESLLARRMFQLMTPEEVSELAARGVRFELHTHRHRTPLDRALFQQEIRDNHQRVQQMTGRNAVHFCYPSGVYDFEFLPWLKEANVASATTCEPGLASGQDHPLLLPRFIDTCNQSPIEFEGWLTGISACFPRRTTPHAARQKLSAGKLKERSCGVALHKSAQ